MNKKYKDAFNAVCPSESSVERIFDMTKNKKVTFKPLLVAAIISTLMVVSLVSANAATDGALVEEAEKVVENIKVFINGKEVSSEDIGYEHSTDADGKVVDRYSLDFGENGEDGYVEFSVDGGEDTVILDGDFDAAMVKEGEDGNYRAYIVKDDNSVDFAISEDGTPNISPDETFVPDYFIATSEPSQEQ